MCGWGRMSWTPTPAAPVSPKTVLFSLCFSACTQTVAPPGYQSVKLIKFEDDTTLAGHISGGG